ncbi:MAG TPA: hypothetical protein VFZ77_10445 [Acidimicrobiales bacterium]
MAPTPTETTTSPVTRQPSGTGPAADPTAAGIELTVIAWPDPVIEGLPGAMPTASDDALVWWTPFVGTIGMVMAHRFAAQAADGPSRWSIEDIAGTFGIAATPARVLRVIDRLERFAIIRRRGNTIAVRLWLPPLTERQRRRLPAYLADAWDTR